MVSGAGARQKGRSHFGLLSCILGAESVWYTLQISMSCSKVVHQKMLAYVSDDVERAVAEEVASAYVEHTVDVQ